MHPYPHHYQASASTTPTGDVRLDSPALPALPSQPPPEFDGPGGLWSPETLLCAAVADCFVLSFRAVARASRFEWLSLEAATRGTLERVEGTTRFTHFHTTATLRVPAGADADRARALLEKSEKVCLVSSSLVGTKHLETNVVTG